jgi:hypothetical protein
MATAAKVTGAGRSVDTKWGDKKIVTRDITFSNSYATGGEAITPASLGLSRIELVFGDAHAKNAAGTSLVPVRFDYTAKKLQAYRYDGASAGKAFLEEVAAAVDLSTFTVRLSFMGKEAP